MIRNTTRNSKRRYLTLLTLIEESGDTGDKGDYILVQRTANGPAVKVYPDKEDDE